MKIDALFVLSAGKGSRMGPIGHHLPKPLWPIFEKNLLELQFEFYRHLNIKRKIINNHHQADKIHHFVTRELKDKHDVHILNEPELLDVGGAILNLKAHHPALHYVLISNVDQFLFVDWEKMKDTICQKEPFNTLLFAIRVHKSQGYHQLEVSPEGDLIGINSRPTDDHYLTYSGTSLVNLTKIESPPQKIGFFESIAHPGRQKVKVIDTHHCAYYDFGTLNLYLNKIMTFSKHIQEGTSDAFLSFLREVNAIHPKKVDQTLNSYHSKRPLLYQFKDLKINVSNHPTIEWDALPNEEEKDSGIKDPS